MAETVLEMRVASLERQLRHFIKWQQTFTSASTAAFPSVDGFIADEQSTGGLGASIAVPKTVEGPLTPAVTPDLSSTPSDIESKTSSYFGNGQIELEKVSAKLSTSNETKLTVQEIPLTPIATPRRSTSPANDKSSLSFLSEAAVIPERASTEVAFRILDIIQGYGQNLGDDDASKTGKRWLGRAKFAPKVEQYVEAGHPIRMILPSFPWKSVSASYQVVPFDKC